MTENERQETEGPITQWVTFRLDGEKYGVAVVRVREVLRATEIAPVPGTPEFVLGIINLRGNVVTVIDTRKRFGLSFIEDTDATRVIIVECDNEVVGMRVDSVTEVMDIPASEIETAPNVGNDESSEFVTGVSSQDNDLVILVDLDRLFGVKDWASVSSY